MEADWGKFAVGSDVFHRLAGRLGPIPHWKQLPSADQQRLEPLSICCSSLFYTEEVSRPTH